MNAEDKATDSSPNQELSALAKPSSEFQICRAYPRYPVDEDSTLLLVSHGLSLQSHVLDLSLEGCRLRLLEPYTVGTSTRIEVSFKMKGIAFRLAGVIQWTSEDHLAGIRFVDVVSRRGEQLSEVIGEMQRAAEAKAVEAREVEELLEKDRAERAAAESEAHEVPLNRETQNPDEPLANEIWEPSQFKVHNVAEAQRDSPDTEAASQSRLQPNVKAQERRDRRTQARRQVDTTATVFLIRVASKLHGHIVDLSMSGCRIRSDERFPVGIYTRVETEFHLEGLPFLLGGVIQTIHDPHNIGVRFLDMSLRKLEQLEQLIAEIARQESMGSEEPSLDSTSPPDANKGIRG